MLCAVWCACFGCEVPLGARVSPFPHTAKAAFTLQRLHAHQHTQNYHQFTVIGSWDKIFKEVVWLVVVAGVSLVPPSLYLDAFVCLALPVKSWQKIILKALRYTHDALYAWLTPCYLAALVRLGCWLTVDEGVGSLPVSAALRSR